MPTDDPPATGSHDAESPRAEFPREVGPYRLERLLGRGGMGEVHQAYDRRLDRRVAIKHIHLDDSRVDAATSRRRIRREARAVARLSHPVIVQIFDILEEEDGDWVVMELVEGPTVAQLLESGPLPLNRALSIARQIAEGLADAHDKGILHRDLKTENVMIAPGGRAKILDFGLAKVLEPSDSDRSLTMAGEVMGTCRSMSPEQAKGLELDGRSDLFALGTLFYEMLAGESPFQGPTAVATMTRVCTVDPPPLDQVTAGVPPEIAELVGRLLAKDREGRPRDAADVAGELGDLAEALGVRESESTWPRASRSWGSSSGELTATATRPALGLRGWLGGRTAVVAIATVLAAALAVTVLFFRGVDTAPPAPGVSSGSGGSAASAPRRTVAMLGFVDLQEEGSPFGWISTALAEMIGAELARVESVRLVSGESVAEARADLDLEKSASLGEEALDRLRDRLGAEIVITGSYIAEATPTGDLRLYVRLYAPGQPETMITLDGRHTRMIDLASDTGARLRQRLDWSAAPEAEIYAGRPTTPEGQEAYYEGLGLLRRHDLVGAREAFERAIQAEPDLALAHASLAEVLSALGYDDRAEAEAARAVELADALEREERLFVEGRFREMSRQWQAAIETYRRLVAFAPDEPRYTLRLAQALLKDSRPSEASEAIRRIRESGTAIGDDPRLDLLEVEAVCATSDRQTCQRLAEREAERGREQGARIQEARARLVLAHQALRGSDPEAAEREAEAARELFALAGDANGEAEALSRLATLIYRGGDIDRAQEGFEAALGKFREIGNRRESAVALNNVAVCQLDRGEVETSRETRLQAVREAEISGSSYARVLLGLNLAADHRQSGRLEEAIRGTREAIAEAAENEHNFLVLAGQITLGRVELARGRLEDARRAFESARVGAEESGDDEMRAFALEGLARTALVAGDLAAAREAARTSLELRQGLGAAEIVSSRSVLAQVLLRIDDPAAALRHLVDETPDSVPPRFAYEAWSLRAHAHALVGDLEAARHARDQARVTDAQCPDEELRLLGRARLARVDALLGETESARRRLPFVIQDAVGNGYVVAELEARVTLAQRLAADGDLPGARRQAEEIAARAEALGLESFVERSATESEDL